MVVSNLFPNSQEKNKGDLEFEEMLCFIITNFLA